MVQSTKKENCEHFQQFALLLKDAISKYGSFNEEEFLQLQKKQIEGLVELEDKFRLTLLSHRYGPWVYREFVNMIVNKRHNILAARPFFRERQNVFAQEISKALKKGHANSLYKFHFNYNFIQFVLKCRKWGKDCPLWDISEQITQMRKELVEMNMPLAISRARIFWNRTPTSQLSYMDLVQISCEGLLAAIDKFCLPFSRVFRAVAIGRILGDFIENYSQTLLHFYPTDKRKIYKAHKILGKGNSTLSSEDYVKLANIINNNDSGAKTSAAELADLVSAASCVSTDSLPICSSPDSEGATVVERYAAEDIYRPDVKCEQEEAFLSLKEALFELSIFERKFLILQGISLE